MPILSTQVQPPPMPVAPPDMPAPVGAADPRPAPSAFDVCHVGVVLRALLLVHGVLGVGALFQAVDWTAWLAAFGVGSSIALPGVLLWLLVACAVRRPLGALPAGGQWTVALGLGAVSGILGSAPAWLLSAMAGGDAGITSRDQAGWVAGLGPALAGAGFAAVALHWLQLRARANLPADTTARLGELQARIRPHFLFNTLNTALALVRLDPARAEGVLEDLAELFRVAISESAEAVALTEEVALAERYLAIEQTRFGSRLGVTWALDPAAGVARVPPLLLQPLVENAVRHGIEPASEGGTIRIRTQVRLGRAVVSIANSVPPGASRPGHGMALDNVRERLRLMHDVAATFEARRVPDGFEVRIVVPL